MRFMLSEADGGALRDIKHHIDLAMEFVAGWIMTRLLGILRTVYAVTRCLEIISEASRRLSAEMKIRHPAIAWKEMAGAGNIYRHDYEEVVAKLVWDTVTLALPPLRSVVLLELSEAGSN